MVAAGRRRRWGRLSFPSHFVARVQSEEEAATTEVVEGADLGIMGDDTRVSNDVPLSPSVGVETVHVFPNGEVTKTGGRVSLAPQGTTVQNWRQLLIHAIDIHYVSQVQMELMKAVSFMYVRPPGYNAESAKAAEIEDGKSRSGQGDATQSAAAASTSSMPDKEPDKTHTDTNKKNRPKDVFGGTLPIEQELEVLKNAPSYVYSGYGQSSGKPSEQDTYADIEPIYICLVETYGTSEENIILEGSCST
ncbi:hypothetical protein GUJ93_ZPchr0011g27695 [Zizania palustris]|uniref:Uncharacterized protein n=1 Tax=Zizania palustris TaxID=103762 RepID=A0A8J5WG75_ZIZPA|nr:hypothetical protein GUJ93_ZPchr0011g27695 [Zizania palustris]